VGRFEVIAETQQRRRWSTPPVPLGKEEWAASMDSQGRITDRKAVEGRIYLGGVAPELQRCARLQLSMQHFFKTLHKLSKGGDLLSRGSNSCYTPAVGCAAFLTYTPAVQKKQPLSWHIEPRPVSICTS
jgi:hypothetical protein